MVYTQAPSVPQHSNMNGVVTDMVGVIGATIYLESIDNAKPDIPIEISVKRLLSEDAIKKACATSADLQAFETWLQQHFDDIYAVFKKCMLRLQADAMSYALRVAADKQNLPRKAFGCNYPNKRSSDLKAKLQARAQSKTFEPAMVSVRDTKQQILQFLDGMEKWRVDTLNARRMIHNWVEVERGVLLKAEQQDGSDISFQSNTCKTYIYERLKPTKPVHALDNAKICSCDGFKRNVIFNCDRESSLLAACHVQNFGYLCLCEKRLPDYNYIHLYVDNVVVYKTEDEHYIKSLFWLKDNRVCIVFREKLIELELHRSVEGVTARKTRTMCSLFTYSFAYNYKCELAVGVQRKVAYILSLDPTVQTRAAAVLQEKVDEWCDSAVTSHAIFLVALRFTIQLFDRYGQPTKRLYSRLHLPGFIKFNKWTYPKFTVVELPESQDFMLLYLSQSVIKYVRFRSQRNNFADSKRKVRLLTNDCSQPESTDTVYRFASLDLQQHTLLDHSRIVHNTDKAPPNVTDVVDSQTAYYLLDAANNAVKRFSRCRSSTNGLDEADGAVTVYSPTPEQKETETSENEEDVIINCFALLNQSTLAVLCNNSKLVHVDANSMQAKHKVRLCDSRPEYFRSEAFMCVLDANRLFFAVKEGRLVYEVTRTNDTMSDWRIAKLHKLPATWRLLSLIYDCKSSQFAVALGNKRHLQFRLSVFSTTFKEKKLLQLPGCLSWSKSEKRYLMFYCSDHVPMTSKMLKVSESYFYYEREQVKHSLLYFALSKLLLIRLLPQGNNSGNHLSFFYKEADECNIGVLKLRLSNCGLTLKTDDSGKLLLGTSVDSVTTTRAASCSELLNLGRHIDSFAESSAAYFLLDCTNKSIILVEKGQCTLQPNFHPTPNTTECKLTEQGYNSCFQAISLLDQNTLLALAQDGTLLHIHTPTMRIHKTKKLRIIKELLDKPLLIKVNSCRLVVWSAQSSLYELTRTNANWTDWRLVKSHTLPEHWGLHHLHFDRSSQRFLLTLKRRDRSFFRFSLLDVDLCEISVCLCFDCVPRPINILLRRNDCYIQDISDNLYWLSCETGSVHRIDCHVRGKALALRKRGAEVSLIVGSKNCLYELKVNSPHA